MRAAGRIPVVGLRDLKKRLTTAPSELHNEALRDRFVLPGTTTIADLNLPRDSTVVAVVRSDRIVVPRGDTLIRVGDEVLVLVTTDSEEEVRQILTGA